MGVDKCISIGNYYSPAALVNHLRSVHQEQYHEYLVDSNEITESERKKNKVHQQTYISLYFSTAAKSTEQFRDRFAEWVVAENMPLITGQSSYFKKMIKSANKTITPPDYRATIDTLNLRKLEAMKALKACVSGEFFSLTADHWTSLANENYGALTIHFIKDFKLKAYVLSCVKHENGASAEEMEVQLRSDMVSWELHNDSFMAIITDSAANMNAFGKQIERWGTKYARHHYCVDHVLQLTALIAFSGNFTAQNYDEDDSVACLRKARDLVSHVNSSTIANEKLAMAQRAIEPGGKVYKLLQDVRTRWWSTTDLIERVIKLEAPLK
jgi:hypothetical protein